MLCRQSALELAMQAQAFHPVQVYLNGLQWNGKHRLDTVFVNHLGSDDTTITRVMTRKWFCAAVARVMRPGCKFDCCLTLMGDQNLGKSSFADVLSKGWFNDSDIDMNSKDGYASLHGNWIIELAELASMKRSDVETVKTFLSKREDTYRPAYARRVASFPRQCVFFGTTNELEFLKDRTGNRRFWTIDVKRKIDRDKLEAEVEQIRAEAVKYWKDGIIIHLRFVAGSLVLMVGGDAGVSGYAAFLRAVNRCRRVPTDCCRNSRHFSLRHASSPPSTWLS